MTVSITFSADQEQLLNQYLARTPYRSAEEWIADLVANVLAPYTQVTPVRAGPLKTLLDQKTAIETSIKNALKPSIASTVKEATL
jgi:hypothetical protein